MSGLGINTQDSQSGPALSREETHHILLQIKSQTMGAIFGQENLITETLCAFLAGGHILMTGAPGLAKTTLVRVFAHQLGLQFSRIQFTPDLLPSDIVGSDILNLDPTTGHRAFSFAPGPIFTNLLLADEINRASPRTQSALLEAMQERFVTVGGKRNKLPPPFMVFATQNPYESEGTFPLPEAQLDRFLVHSLVDYPDLESETTILKEHAKGELIGEQFTESLKAGPSVAPDSIQRLMALTRGTRIDDGLVQGIAQLIRYTRPHEIQCPDKLKSMIWYGAGPRAGIALISMAKAFAVVEASESVTWKHIKRMAYPVLRHRIRLTAQAMREGFNEDKIISEIMNRFEETQKNLALGIG